MALIERLSWDSTFFGFPVGKLNAETLSRAQLEQVEDKVRELGIRCLYWDAGCGDYESAQAAAASSFVPIEVRVFLSLKDGHEFEQQPQDLSPIGVELDERIGGPIHRAGTRGLRGIARKGQHGW